MKNLDRALPLNKWELGSQHSNGSSSAESGFSPRHLVQTSVFCSSEGFLCFFSCVINSAREARSGESARLRTGFTNSPTKENDVEF